MPVSASARQGRMVEQMTDDEREFLQVLQDQRVEDVARTIHFLEALDRDSYFQPDYKFPWETEAWGAIKVTRDWARYLIEKFDERAKALDG